MAGRAEASNPPRSLKERHEGVGPQMTISWKLLRINPQLIIMLCRRSIASVRERETQLDDCLGTCKCLRRVPRSFTSFRWLARLRRFYGAGIYHCYHDLPPPGFMLLLPSLRKSVSWQARRGLLRSLRRLLQSAPKRYFISPVLKRIAIADMLTESTGLGVWQMHRCRLQLCTQGQMYYRVPSAEGLLSGQFRIIVFFLMSTNLVVQATAKRK